MGKTVKSLNVTSRKYKDMSQVNIMIDLTRTKSNKIKNNFRSNNLKIFLKSILDILDKHLAEFYFFSKILYRFLNTRILSKETLQLFRMRLIFKDMEAIQVNTEPTK